MPVRLADPKHESFYHELCELVTRHADGLSKTEVLALASNVVGKLLAMQDQRAITPAEAMDLILRNIEMGNREVVDAVRSASGRVN